MDFNLLFESPSFVSNVVYELACVRVAENAITLLGPFAWGEYANKLLDDGSLLFHGIDTDFQPLDGLVADPSLRTMS